MKKRNHFTCGVCLSLGLAIAVVIFSSLSSASAANKSAVDPRADEWLKRMGDYLGQAKSFSVNAEIWQDVQLSNGQRVQAGRNIKLQIRHPDRIHAEVHSTRRNRELFYDGKTITLFDRVEKFYGVVNAPGTIDKATDLAAEKFGISMPLEDFVGSNPYKDLVDKVTSGADIGPVDVMGVPCEHLAFSEDDIDWQVWIEAGPKPVPRKFLITYKDEDNSPQFMALFSGWDFATPLPDFVFKFEPPPGSSQIKVEELKAGLQPRKKEAK